MPYKHGHWMGRRASPTHNSWAQMKKRCLNPTDTNFPVYGGAGITVCEQWKDFEAFLADVGERPSLQHSLDRWPRGTGNYEPGNVRWATRSEQALNRKTTRPVRRSDGVLFPSMKEAAQSVGGTRQLVWDVCNGRQDTHKGYSWEYA